MRRKPPGRRKLAIIAKEEAYIERLAEQRGWSFREAKAYTHGGDVALAIVRGQIAREQRAQNIAEVIQAADWARQERRLAGLDRVFTDCDNPRCELPKNHSGPHYYKKFNPMDVEEAEPEF